MPKIHRSLKNNGSPLTIFHTDGIRQSFWTEIEIHPEFLIENEALHVGRQVNRQVNRQVAAQLVDYCMVPQENQLSSK